MPNAVRNFVAQRGFASEDQSDEDVGEDKDKISLY